MTTSSLDMRYGRQGGRLVPWAADARERDVCSACGRPSVAGTHRECEQPDAPSLFDAVFSSGESAPGPAVSQFSDRTTGLTRGDAT